jgi:uncharacterized repeat protein (TIGR03803 family)
MNSKSDGKCRLKWGERVSSAVRVVVAAALPLLGVSEALAQTIQPIYSFPESPATPFAGLLQGPDGNFYGTTWEGGSNGVGAVIKVAPNGAWTTLHSFSPLTRSRGTFFTNSEGAQPWSALALGPDGNLYGTTWNGGSNTDGTVYKVTTNGVFTLLVTFAGTNGANPESGLTPGPDGNLYGTTYNGGSSGNGTVFNVTTNGVLTVLHSFPALIGDGVTGSNTNSDGAGPIAGLALGTNGYFYGTASAGGRGGSGTVFEVTTNGSWTNYYAFSAENYNNSGLGASETNADGASPSGALALGPDGNLYGTTDGGGKSGSGTVFELTPFGVSRIATLYTFTAGRYVFSGETDYYTNFDGAFPDAGLALGTNGNFYGTALGGGTNGLGTIFEITTGGTFTKLLTFTSVDGANPRGALALGTNGNFYGTTEEGGSAGNGTVFEMTGSGVLTTLVNFANSSGASPYAGLTLEQNGTFYGTTYQGGTNGAGVQVTADGYGTAFEITTNGALTTLFNFGTTNGENPEAALTPGPNGNYYGTTYAGGSNNDGTVFEINANGVLTTLASFTNTIGAGSRASLILGTNGNFYGTTVNGGADGAGTVFEVTTGGVLTLLYSFTGDNDGEAPEAGLTLGTNGNLYGTSAYGGDNYNGYGTVFEITNDGGFTVLHTFTDGSDGASPFGSLVLGPNGNYYGTTAGDDSSTYGNVFEMTPGGALTNLYTFTGGSASGSPNGLILGPDGNFYGTTYGGTAAGDFGIVFEVTPNGAFTNLVSFAGTNGESSKGNLTLGPDGNFYGTTSYGGADGIGEIYRLDLPPEIVQPPAGQSPATGAGVTLSVALFGTAPYSFQWLSNNIVILGATNSTLTIPDFAAADAADYSVIVSNAWGSVTSVGALLTLEAAPMISSITLSANGNVTLGCQGPTNVTLRLWATTNLVAPVVWTPLFTNSVTSPGGAWQFTDTNRFYQQKYYRLSTP